METSKTERTLQVGAKALIINDEAKYLLLRRSVKKYPEAKGRWDIPGGRIEPGTPLRENLAREIKEETGLDLVGVPKVLAAQDILRVPSKYVVRITYSVNATGKILLDTEENDEYKWYTKEELLRLDDVDMYFKELLDDGILDH